MRLSERFLAHVHVEEWECGCVSAVVKITN